MGVCNITPDSFSDGGAAFAEADACAVIDRLVLEGADVIDIGGESTRPGAATVSDDEQLRRVLPAVRYACARSAVVSIDTQSPAVAEACLAAGAHVVNDVSCLRDHDLACVVARTGAAYVLMHARGKQEDMRGFGGGPNDAYGDVVADVLTEWRAAASVATSLGVDARGIVFDPGLGFAKNAVHSATLLARVDELVRGAGHPVLVGASRKSFLTLADKGAAPLERVGASVAAALAAVAKGATLLRVHDVRATRQALDLGRRLATLQVPNDSTATARSLTGRELS